MKNYYCTLCGYRHVFSFDQEEKEENIYRRPQHSADGGPLVASPEDSPEFRSLSEGWRCPHCGALKRFFRPEPDGRPPQGN